MKQFLFQTFNTLIFTGLYKFYEFYLPYDTFGKAFVTTIFMTFIPIIISFFFTFFTPSKLILNPDLYYTKYIRTILISQILQFFTVFLIYYFAFANGYLMIKGFNIIKTILYQTIIWEFHNVIFYTVHRLTHESKILYKYVHEDHHIDNTMPNNFILASKISIIETIMDVPFHIFLNCILLPDLFNHFIIINLLTIVFYAGHTGMYVKFCAHATLFQFLNHYFFPLNVCVKTQEHYDHHRYFNCNYEFGSTLIDKLLGTYREFKK